MKKKKHPLVGRRVLCISGDYKGEEGTIEYCSTCCRAYRIEWDKIGNNVNLKPMRKHIIFIN